jgi:glutamyl-Q tRNA(Asp) synthetase
MHHYGNTTSMHCIKTPAYTGRFAPSPTGPLHFGSLIAALASYLHARAQQGRWLLRMEDVDEPRNQANAADNILRTLDNYGFQWDGDILYQTQRKDAYNEALQQLTAQDLIYRCICSRKDLHGLAEMGKYGAIYPGRCEHQHHSAQSKHALRVKTHNDPIAFSDAIMGDYKQQLKTDIGDFIVRRRDGLFAYQLAVVVDDARQNITHIVRGSDLLDSTPRQIYLQQCLHYSTPAYTHLPIAVNAQDAKLSKQTGAAGINETADIATLVDCMNFLGQRMPVELKRASLHAFWQWAFEYWDLNAVPRQTKIRVCP